MIYWFDLLAIQGTLKSILQHHSSKASIFLALNLLYGPTFTSVHDYWKNHSFDYMSFVSKVKSLLFNTLSRFVIAFFPKEQVSFNVIAAVTNHSDFGVQEKKLTVSTFSPSIYQEVMKLDAMILGF